MSGVRLQLLQLLLLLLQLWLLLLLPLRCGFGCWIVGFWRLRRRGFQCARVDVLQSAGFLLLAFECQFFSGGQRVQAELMFDPLVTVPFSDLLLG